MVRQVFVERPTGGCKVLWNEDGVTVEDARAQVAHWEGVSASDVRLMWGARDLQDGDELADGATLFAALRLLGGGKKRKKKNYTTPKKIKHKKKKVSLATLKYYKVSDDGDVTRLRKVCPSDICGEGIFMAQHKDRHYCGKCALTYVME